MGKGLVFSAIFGNRSSLLPVGVKEEGVDYLMFTDKPPKSKDHGWQIVPCKPSKNKNHRLRSRVYKWKIEEIPDGYDWTLWIDSTHNLKVPVRALVEDVWLKDCEIAAFPHPIRSCSYREIDACVRRGKETVKVLDVCREHLRSMKFPKDSGLYALGVVARRVTEKQKEFGLDLFGKLKQFSARDQIFFVQSLMRCGIKCHSIQPGTVYRSEFFDYHGPHG